MANLVKSACVFLWASAAFAQNEPGPAQASGTAAPPEAAQAPQRRPASAFLVTGQPYSAEQTNDHVQTLIDGTRLTQHISTTKLYRDSQGRFRIERTVGIVPRLYRTTEIYDPAAGVQYNLDATRRTARKSAFSGTFTAITPSVGCPTDLSDFTVPNLHERVTCIALGTKMIDGLEAAGARIIGLIPVGVIGNDKPITTVTEIWTSPELKVTLLQTETDPRTGDGTQKLVSISREEPDASLFRPPDDYRIIAPPSGRDGGDLNSMRR